MSSGEAPPTVAVEDARLVDTFRNLGFGDGIAAEAAEVLRECDGKLFVSPLGAQSSEVTEQCGHAFLLYCITKLLPGETKAQLKHILKGCNVKIDYFIKEILQFTPKVDSILGRRYGPDWIERVQLKQMEKTVEILAEAAKFYSRAFMEVFSIQSEGELQISGNITEISGTYRFGWLLFLLLRCTYPEQFKDLVSCIHALVAILVILIIHTPATRKLNIQDSSLCGNQSLNNIDIVAYLSQKHHTSEDRLKEILRMANNLVKDVLNKKSCNVGRRTDNVDHIKTDDVVFFEDLLDEKSLSSDVYLLERHYDLASPQSELDERIFVADKECLKSLLNTFGGSNGIGSTKCNFDDGAFPARASNGTTCPTSPTSPNNDSLLKRSQIVEMTPVSSSMTTAKWLRECITPSSEKPSPELKRYLSSCDRDLTRDVVRRVNVLLEAIFPPQSFGERCASRRRNLANTFDTIWARERKAEASKLYYKVLEAISRAESKRGSGQNLTSLLSSERFHRCLLACTAELVLATHKTVIMMLPTVLETAGLTAFDLSKVIESIVRHEESLPRELKRHLNSLEEQLLESMAWEKGSSLYNSLLFARPQLATEINRLGLLADPMPSLDEIAARNGICIEDMPPMIPAKRANSSESADIERSPKRPRTESRSVVISTPPIKKTLSLNNHTPQLHSAFASPAVRNPRGEADTCGDVAIKIFFSKILKLGAIRIRNLCDRIRQPEITSPAYSLFEKILNEQTALFFNRHIDQLILCCIYGAAKVSKLNMIFKELVNNYKRQPQCKPDVYKSVFVSSFPANRNGGFEAQHVDIISFYNKVFIPSAKEYLVQIPSSGSFIDNKKNESPKLSLFSSLPDMSPKKISPSHNVYVSPIRQSKMDALLSPSSRSFYACIGEGTRAYRSPSNDLADINNCLKSHVRRIDSRLMLNYSVISDDTVAGSLSQQNSGDRATFSEAKPFLDVPTNRQEQLE